MTHHTDAERAEFEAWRVAEIRKDLPKADVTDGHIRHVFMRWSATQKRYLARDAQIGWEAWKAARRAPAAPVPQVSIEKLEDWKRRVNTLATCGLKADRYRVGTALKQDIADAIAAAPQPPEAAPVELPEPDAWMATPVMQSGRGATTVFCSDKRMADQWDYGGHPEYGRMLVTGLFTEQQVREMLAAHGIGKDKA